MESTGENGLRPHANPESESVMITKKNPLLYSFAF